MIWVTVDILPFSTLTFNCKFEFWCIAACTHIQSTNKLEYIIGHSLHMLYITFMVPYSLHEIAVGNFHS